MIKAGLLMKSPHSRSYYRFQLCEVSHDARHQRNYSSADPTPGALTQFFDFTNIINCVTESFSYVAVKGFAKVIFDSTIAQLASSFRRKKGQCGSNEFT